MKAPSILAGEKVYLAPVAKEDLELFYKWGNDLEIGQYLTTPTFLPITLEDQEMWYEKLKDNSYKRIFSIRNKNNNNTIGRIDLEDINWIYNTAYLSIFIGEKKLWGKGYGSEAIKLALDFCFNILGLHNISVEIFSYNRRSLKAFSKVGFRKIGTRKEVVFFAGKYHDTILMEILAKEFNRNFDRRKNESQKSK